MHAARPVSAPFFLLNPPLPMTGLFLSDLHLFSRRSVGQQLWNQNRTAIVTAKSIVLGGDIFDFRWSELGGLDATLAGASRWLQDAIALNPTAAWIYLLGNHDCHPRMQELLSSLQGQHPNFAWSPTFWRIGSNVFLHGDILDGQRRFSGLDTYRERFHDEAPKGPVGNLLYSAVIESRLHSVVPRLRRTRRQTCRKLLLYLESCDAGLLPEVQNIYFGHTHIPMARYRFDRFDFHNTGSGIRYLTLKPATFEVT